MTGGGGIARGDRAVFLGPGQLRGRHADVLSTRRAFTAIAVDDGPRVLTLTVHVHPIPRRPRPDF